MEIIRVLCVDDHRLMRAGITKILNLEQDIEVVAEASTGDEAVELFREHRPEIALLDLQMPGMEGAQVIRAIKEAAPAARVIVLTMYAGDEDVYSAVDAGASGYLLKDSEPDDLVRAIRLVHAGRFVVSPLVLSVLKERKDRATLTARERQVLQVLARGLRDKEIAEELSISLRTVQVHIKNIFAKFEVHDRSAALIAGLRRGFLHLD